MPDKELQLGNRSEWGDDLGEVVSDDEAAKIIADVLDVGHDYNYVANAWPQGRKNATLPMPAKREQIYNLIRGMVAMIPPELRTEVVLRGMDMRTLLDTVALQADAVSTKVPVVVNGIEFSPDEQARARSLFVDYGDRVDEELNASATSQNMDPTAQLEWQTKEANKWRTDKNKIVPMTVTPQTVVKDQQSGEQQVIGATPSDPNAFVAPAFDDTATGTMSFMTANDVKLMFRDDSAGGALGQYMNNLAQQEADAATLGINDRRLADPTNLDLEGITSVKNDYHADTSSIEGIAAASSYRGRLDGGFTLTQAKSLPLYMTREQITTLSDRMQKAGIYDQIGGKEPAIKGDPTDPQFKEAYLTLLGKSIQLGRSPELIMRDGALSYEEQLKDKAHTQVTDPARIRLQSDAVARTVLGRTLSGGEHQELVNFIHGLERKTSEAELRATGIPGENGTEGEGGETIAIDWTAQMEEFLTRENRAEAGAKDVANAYDMFKGMLGPAGGSMSR